MQEMNINLKYSCDSIGVTKNCFNKQLVNSLLSSKIYIRSWNELNSLLG